MSSTLAANLTLGVCFSDTGGGCELHTKDSVIGSRPTGRRRYTGKRQPVDELLVGFESSDCGGRGVAARAGVAGFGDAGERGSSGGSAGAGLGALGLGAIRRP